VDNLYYSRNPRCSITSSHYVAFLHYFKAFAIIL